MGIIDYFKHEIKLRKTAKPFDIYKECVCEKGQNGLYWLGYDDLIYYGHRWFVFQISHQNSWYKRCGAGEKICCWQSVAVGMCDGSDCAASALGHGKKKAPSACRVQAGGIVANVVAY